MSNKNLSFLLLLALTMAGLLPFQGSAYEKAPLYEIIPDQAEHQILTPTFAKRKSVKVRLNNGLEAYIISDPNADKSSAALSVNVGSWDEPNAYPGIAHFLEHLLFLGNKKYPQESEYNRYIAEHDGEANAFTTNDFTSYMFTVSNEAFEGALDRFSSFFKEPLFNPSGVSRELNAIDQEFAKSLENDNVREIQVLKELGNPRHPNNRFNFGNSQSLAKVSQESLKKWYYDHYSANLMKLVVVSPMPLEALKEMVVEDFSDIPTYSKKPGYIAQALSNPDYLGKMVFIQPVKNVRTLTLIWELPPEFGHKIETKPERLLCFVLGHEGRESLLAQLKREKLAEELQCGAQRMGDDKMEMFVEITLTDEGLQKLNQVIERTFEAIAVIRKKGIPEYVFKEQRAMDIIHYQYQKRQDSFTQAMQDAMLLTHEDMATFPEKTLIIQKYSPEDVNKLLNFLTPYNSYYFVKAPSSLTGIKPDQTENWMGVQYAVKPIDPELLKAWASVTTASSTIDLPAPNVLIPQNLKVITRSESLTNESRLNPVAKEILKNDSGLFYYVQDDRYFVPEIYWYLEIKTPQIELGKTLKVVQADLYIKSLEEALNKYIYNAQLAGLDFKINRIENGISLLISGYHENAHLIFEEVLKYLKQLHPPDHKFKIYQQSLLRDYQNFSREMPLKQAFEVFKHAVYRNFTTEKQKAAAIRKVTYDKFTEYLSGLFNQVYVQGIFYGHMEEAEAKKQAEKLLEVLGGVPYPKAQQLKTEVIDLDQQKGPYLLDVNTKSQGNAAILAIENPDFSLKARAAQQILMQAAGEAFFSQLRTKQQTGYLVTSAGEELEKHLFNLFAVQSNTHDPRDLLARFELFIEGYLQELTTEISEERFEIIRRSLVNNLKKGYPNMTSMGDLLKTLAFKYDGDFNWMERRLKNLEEITYEEFLVIVRTWMGRDNHRRLGILLKGVIPEAYQFEYQKLPNIFQLRQSSTYTGKEKLGE